MPIQKHFENKKEAQEAAEKRGHKVFKNGKKWFVGTDIAWLNL